MLEFKFYIENEALRNGIRGTILDFLKDALNIKDDDTILSMNFGAIDQKVVSDLLSRGVITTADESIMQDLKNGTITVAELIERLSGGSKPPSRLPYMKIPLHNQEDHGKIYAKNF